MFRTRIAFYLLIAANTAAFAENSQANISVAVDLSGLSDGTFDKVDALSLEKSLTVRLIQSGYAVVSRDKSPQIRVNIGEGKGAITVTVERGKQTLHSRIVLSGQLTTDHLEITQKVTALLRELAQAKPPTNNPTPRSNKQTKPPPAKLTEDTPPLRWSISPAVGLLIRNQTDPTFGVQSSVGSTRWRYQLSIDATRSSTDELTVWETFAAATVMRTTLMRRKWSVGAGISAGLLWHRADRAANIFHRYDPILCANFLVAYQGARIEVGVVVDAGTTFRTRAHALANNQLWSRSAFFVRPRLYAGVSW